MREKLAYVAIVISALGILLSACMPFVIRAQRYDQMHRFGMDSAADKVVAAEVKSAAPCLLISGALSIAGVIIGVGLLRRREWARLAWLIVCSLWLIEAVYRVVLSADWMGGLSLAFKLIVLVASLRILTKPDIRNEFSNS